MAGHVMSIVTNGRSCHVQSDQRQVMSKVGHLQPFYLFLSRLGCSLGELQDGWPDKFCQAKHPEDQKPASIYGQDMEFLMTESHMHLQEINPALIYCREQQQKYVFHQVEFVDKNNLEAQNPRRDTSIPSVSAGLPPSCLKPRF